MTRLLIAIAAATIIAAAAYSAGPPQPKPEPGRKVEYAGTLLVQLRVADLDRAVDFYQNALGLKIKSRNEQLRWAKFKTGIKGVSIGVGEGPVVEGSGTASINIGVKDVDRARAALAARGVTFTGKTITIPGVVKLADLKDPDGNRIRLAQDLSGS